MSDLLEYLRTMPNPQSTEYERFASEQQKRVAAVLGSKDITPEELHKQIANKSKRLCLKFLRDTQY